MPNIGFWRLPKDLESLHDEVIGYAVEIHHAATAKFEANHNGPLSHAALFTLHFRAIVVHRSIRAVCETGWTPCTPILIRTLLDIIASSYAVAAKPEDAEYMGFKFMGSYLIQSLNDADTSEELRKTESRSRNCAKGCEERISLVLINLPKNTYHSLIGLGPNSIAPVQSL